jgi:hypothetical protein
MDEMVKEMPMEEFRNSGLLWFINQQLHLFGACIAIEYQDGKPVRMYPAQCKFRGFSERDNDQGYMNLSKYIQNNAAELVKDCLPSGEAPEG